MLLAPCKCSDPFYHAQLSTLKRLSNQPPAYSVPNYLKSLSCSSKSNGNGLNHTIVVSMEGKMACESISCRSRSLGLPVLLRIK